MMRRQQQQQRRRQQQQQQSASARRPWECPQERKNKKRDPLLCKCLVAMGMCRFVDDFDNFTQFIRMSPDQCRLYGPEFVVKYAKLHARIEALCASAFSVLGDFEPHDAACYDVDGEPVAADASAASAATVPVVAASQGKNLVEWAPENAGEFFACDEDDDEDKDEDDRGCEGHGDRVQPHSPLRRSDALGPGGLIPCTELFGLSSEDDNGQVIEVCSHLVGTCDAHEKWVRRNLQN